MSHFQRANRQRRMNVMSAGFAMTRAEGDVICFHDSTDNSAGHICIKGEVEDER